MASGNMLVGSTDQYGLRRFVEAQEGVYGHALSEVRRGRKNTHWMWYIFPQLVGLGSSAASKRFAIRSLEQAEAYLAHPVLGPRLVECCEAALAVEGRSACEIFGCPDEMKLRSCATLFACVSPPGSVFEKVLAKYFRGEPDEKTLRLLGRPHNDSWRPDHYLRFGDERTRPAIDLLARIQVESPGTVVDLGCGPGNSTAVLSRRWPDARVIGVDNSPAMIDAARAERPDREWVLADIATWSPEDPVDVMFSNAALQWVPDHGPLVERLFGCVAPRGALAFQIPSTTYALVRVLIHEIARTGDWAPRMAAPLTLLTMESPAFYYDHLAPLARSLDVWETEYLHVMESPDAIVDFISSTGLRPFLQALDTEAERQEFVARLLGRVRESYEVRPDGRVLYPFRRTFVVAYA
jgi:trans-aconitate 2-methyltransferase